MRWGSRTNSRMIGAMLGRLAFCFIGIAVLDAAERIPIIASVDRFGRHGEIDEPAAGRLLITELGCVNCHDSQHPLMTRRVGPSLVGAGRRLRSDWVDDYLRDPSQVHPGTTMPDLVARLTPRQRRQTSADIAAFLATKQQDFPIIKASGTKPVPFEFWKRGRVDAGRRLYHEVGCVACHAPSDDFEVAASSRSPLDAMLDGLDDDELQELGLAAAARAVTSVPHPNLASKYTSRGLTHFLLDPSRYHPGGRMPSFKLSPVEAADLASFLISRDQRELSRRNESETGERRMGNEEAGRRAFGELGCVSCHDVGSVVENTLQAPPLSSLQPRQSPGCLQADHGQGASYSLDDFQRRSIITAIESTDFVDQVSVNDRLQHQLSQLNCYACHVRDGIGGVGRKRKDFFQTVDNIDLGDEGRLPPPLSHAGFKIKPDWFARVLAGKNADIRPHMTIRMPRFHPSEVVNLPKWFATVDARNQQAGIHKHDRANDDLVSAGRELMDIGCIQCHSFDGFAMPGVVGVDLSGATDRVQSDWFTAFLRDPGAMKPMTRMPSFFGGGQAQNRDLLDGDPERQIAAMWNYLRDVPKHSLPQKILDARSQDYELVPRDRPLLLRTFMRSAGTHAIAVGLPQQVHFAFDAEQARLAIAWRGRFLDAQGTWFVRFSPPAEPLGDSLIELQRESVFCLSSQHTQADFRQATKQLKFGGYRLDADGIPTFLYRVGQLQVEDRITATSDGGLRRTWQMEPIKTSPTGPDTRLAFSPLLGRSLRAQGRSTYIRDDGLQIHVRGLPEDAASIVPVENTEDTGDDGYQRLLYWLDSSELLTLEVEYRW